MILLVVALNGFMTIEHICKTGSVLNGNLKKCTVHAEQHGAGGEGGDRRQGDLPGQSRRGYRWPKIGARHRTPL